MTLEFGTILILAVVALVMVISLFLVVCRKYEDGIVGNIFLILAVVAAGIILFDAWKSEIMLPDKPWLLLILCLSVILARHAWRFAMFHWHGWFGWAPPPDISRAREHPTRFYQTMAK